MDGVVDVDMAVRLSQLGALGVLNLEGVQTRYEDPNQVLDRIAAVGKDEFVPLMQEIYSQPVQEALIRKRIQAIKAQGGIAAVSGTPVAALRFGKAIAEAGADLFFVQATVVSTITSALKDRRPSISKPSVATWVSPWSSELRDLRRAMQLMRAGAAGVMVESTGGCLTSRGVLGVGIPQATAVADCAAARADYEKETGRYVPIVADGGIVTGGDICKCIACGADAVMIGSPIARADEAPGRGFHWGMATPSPVLPRGTRINVGSTGSIERILRGPAKLDDGTHNLLGCLKTSMGTLGARTIEEMQQVEVVVAPSLLTEGKVYQKAQHLGMGK